MRPGNRVGIVTKAVGSLVEDSIRESFQTLFGDRPWNDRNTAPVNIEETELEYTIYLMAPTLKKEAFAVNVDEDVLHIVHEDIEEEKPEQEENVKRWLRREYRPGTFRRSFTLNNKVKTEDITAKYVDGVLTVTLPKKEIVEVNITEEKK